MISSITIFLSAFIPFVFSAVPTHPTTTAGPDCDYIIADGIHNPIGVCINSDGLSYRLDYDSTNDKILYKYFESDDCMGKSDAFRNPKTPSFTNLNTGNLCKTFGVNSQRITRNSTTYEIVIDAPGSGDHRLHMKMELFGLCYEWTSHIYYKNIKCKQGVMEWIWYKDSECTDEIPSEKYVMSGFIEGVKDIKYYKKYEFGDRYKDRKFEDVEIKYIALDVICVDQVSDLY
eukprot:531115_1